MEIEKIIKKAFDEKIYPKPSPQAIPEVHQLM